MARSITGTNAAYFSDTIAHTARTSRRKVLILGIEPPKRIAANSCLEILARVASMVCGIVFTANLSALTIRSRPIFETPYSICASGSSPT